MKKETIFKHELNESIQANVAMNCLKNRNNHKQINESADFDAEDFISEVVNLMEDEGMIDNSQWDEAYYTVEEMVQSNPNLLQYPSYMQFLNVFGDDILSNLNYQEQEEDVDDAEEFISEVVNLMEDEGMIDDSQWDAAYYTVEEMVQSNPELLHYPSYMQFINVFGDDILSNLNYQEQEELSVEQEELPQMERRDMILALSEYMSESWIDTGDDGDLDDIYYAVADILDKTGDYPASTNWEDCKPWCQKHYKEVEAKIY